MDKDQLTLMDLKDIVRRKRLFRDAGAALSGKIARGTCDDVPDAIARLMERSFQTGLAMKNVPGLDVQNFDVPLPLTEADLPAKLRSQLYKFKLLVGLGIDGSKRRAPSLRGMVLIMPPRRLEYSAPLGRDQWLSPILKQGSPFSLNTINKMVELGLYEPPCEVDDGWMITSLSEWGLELLTTGKTSHNEYRTRGASETQSLFESVMGNFSAIELFERTAGELGFRGRNDPTPPSPTFAFRP